MKTQYFCRLAAYLYIHTGAYIYVRPHTHTKHVYMYTYIETYAVHIQRVTAHHYTSRPSHQTPVQCSGLWSGSVQPLRPARDGLVRGRAGHFCAACSCASLSVSSPFACLWTRSHRSVWVSRMWTLSSGGWGTKKREQDLLLLQPPNPFGHGDVARTGSETL